MHPLRAQADGDGRNHRRRLTGAYNVNRGYTTNGLNQYTLSGAATLSYDSNGNLIGDGTNSYGYDPENRLVSMSIGASLAYDPLGRLWQVTSASTNNRFLTDGDQLALEYDASGNVARRYAFGGGGDQPVLEDSGGALACGTTTRFLSSDIRGSVIAQADCAGNRQAINAYDEYGIPASTNTGRFQYTGQAWLPELGMYYYKARIYSPTLGRFMQTDPIGVAGGINLYGYVGGDPVNNDDPSGLLACGANGFTLIMPSKYPPTSSGASGVVTALGYPVCVYFNQQNQIASGGTGGIGGIGGIGGGVTFVPPCAYKNISGMCIYTRDKNGRLQNTPEFQKQICANFAALQDGAAKTNDTLTAVGVLGGSRGGLVGTIIGGLSAFGAFISSITTGAGYRPSGVTIIPKSAPPPGC
jgi:RHS repeat-associated protein